MGGWIANGQVKSRETVVDGLEQTPEAFLGLFSGKNTGKMLVKL
jgi:NADPH-dependent curcumin reductase CurA